MRVFVGRGRDGLLFFFFNFLIIFGDAWSSLTKAYCAYLKSTLVFPLYLASKGQQIEILFFFSFFLTQRRFGKKSLMMTQKYNLVSSKAFLNLTKKGNFPKSCKREGGFSVASPHKELSCFPRLVSPAGVLQSRVGQIPGARAEEGRRGEGARAGGLRPDRLARFCGGGNGGFPTLGTRFIPSLISKAPSFFSPEAPCMQRASRDRYRYQEGENRHEDFRMWSSSVVFPLRSQTAFEQGGALQNKLGYQDHS